MMHRVLALSALAVLPFLAACGKNPTDNLDFKAPNGWTSTPSMFGFKMWIKGDKGNGQVVFLMDLPGKADINFSGDLSKELGNKGYSGGDIGVVQKQSDIKICGDHPAKYVEAVAQKSGTKTSTEMIITKWDKDAYLALYTHPAAVASDPAAEDAIHSVCMKK